MCEIVVVFGGFQVVIQYAKKTIVVMYFVHESKDGMMRVAGEVAAATAGVLKELLVYIPEDEAIYGERDEEKLTVRAVSPAG